MANFIYNNIINIAVFIVLCYFVYIVTKEVIRFMVILIILLPLAIFIKLALLFHLIKRDPLEDSEWYLKWFKTPNPQAKDYTIINRDWGYEEEEKNKKDTYSDYLQAMRRGAI